MEPYECFELLKPQYGSSDAGDLWQQTLHRHLTQDLRLQPKKTDPSSYYLFNKGNLVGINGTYVNDLLRAGNAQFRLKCELTHKRFETSVDAEIPMTFAGFHVTRPKHYPFSIDQNLYVTKLEELDPWTDFPIFRSLRMRLAWLSNTPPDLLFEISQHK